MRIVQLLEQAVFREYHCIVNDNVLLYGTDFVSTNSDFYTNKERQELFGCLVANMLVQQYLDVSALCRVVLPLSVSTSHFVFFSYSLLS
jgi:hypothetical protein